MCVSFTPFFVGKMPNSKKCIQSLPYYCFAISIDPTIMKLDIYHNKTYMMYSFALILLTL